MTLLLGPPGAGKTTLLLALAGKLDKSLRVSFLFILRRMFGVCNVYIWREDKRSSNHLIRNMKDVRSFNFFSTTDWFPLRVLCLKIIFIHFSFIFNCVEIVQSLMGTCRLSVAYIRLLEICLWELIFELCRPAVIWKCYLQRSQSAWICRSKNKLVHQSIWQPHWGAYGSRNVGLCSTMSGCWLQIWWESLFRCHATGLGLYLD